MSSRSRSARRCRREAQRRQAKAARTVRRIISASPAYRPLTWAEMGDHPLSAISAAVLVTIRKDFYRESASEFAGRAGVGPAVIRDAESGTWPAWALSRRDFNAIAPAWRLLRASYKSAVKTGPGLWCTGRWNRCRRSAIPQPAACTSSNSLSAPWLPARTGPGSGTRQQSSPPLTYPPHTLARNCWKCWTTDFPLMRTSGGKVTVGALRRSRGRGHDHLIRSSWASCGWPTVVPWPCTIRHLPVGADAKVRSWQAC